MRIESLDARERNTLVILGAGATRGASFVQPDEVVPPPLDGDFFQILQMSAAGRTREGRALIEHVRTVYGPMLSVGLETVFNNLDAAQTFHSSFNVTRGRYLEEPKRLMDYLRVVLPAVLGETICEGCEHHAALARKLRVGDAVISLNYDCLIDKALSTSAGTRFDPERNAYGVEVSSGAGNWRSTGRGKKAKGSILLLKLHGSLNWRAGGPPLRLRADPYQMADPGVIAPPLTNKPVQDRPFSDVWKQARVAVGRMRRLIIIGYSMPDGDGLVRTLLATDLSPSLEEIVIVDPSNESQQKHVELFTRVAAKARVLTLKSFGQFAGLL